MMVRYLSLYVCVFKKQGIKKNTHWLHSSLAYIQCFLKFSKNLSS
jgi:hypothetical protein